jgi:hypothetical protein
MKKAEGKYEPHLVYKSAIESMARVRAYGRAKHGSETDWKTTQTLQHLDAARRHIDETIDAIQEGDLTRLYDKESGELHWGHAMCNLMFEIERYTKTGAINPGIPCVVTIHLDFSPWVKACTAVANKLKAVFSKSKYADGGLK